MHRRKHQYFGQVICIKKHIQRNCDHKSHGISPGLIITVSSPSSSKQIIVNGTKKNNL